MKHQQLCKHRPDLLLTNKVQKYTALLEVTENDSIGTKIELSELKYNLFHKRVHYIFGILTLTSVNCKMDLLLVF